MGAGDSHPSDGTDRTATSRWDWTRTTTRSRWPCSARTRSSATSTRHWPPSPAPMTSTRSSACGSSTPGTAARWRWPTGRSGRCLRPRARRPASGSAPRGPRSARRCSSARRNWRRSGTRACWSRSRSTSRSRCDGDPRGARHPLEALSERIADVFVAMGWEVAEGPEVEAEWFNFDALNFDPRPPGPADAGHVLRRPARIRPRAAHAHLPGAGPRAARARGAALRHLPRARCSAPTNSTPPTRRSSTRSRVWRSTEGLTMAHLKGTLDHFARAMFGADVRTRLRPSFFPFTEPSAELDVLCFVCGAAGPRRAAPARAPAGSSGAAAAWCTRTCCAPAASTPRSTPASPSGWASSAR